MASKYKIKQSAVAEGILRIEDNTIVLEIDELGDINLENMLSKFNGELIKINISTVEDIV